MNFIEALKVLIPLLSSGAIGTFLLKWFQARTKRKDEDYARELKKDELQEARIASLQEQLLTMTRELAAAKVALEYERKRNGGPQGGVSAQPGPKPPPE